MKLSVLICGTFNRVRDGYSEKILSMLEPQLTEDVEVLYFVDNKKRSVGEKRNDLMNMAHGKYIVYVDDDDKVSDDYISVLLMLTSKNPDVAVFGVNCSVNGGSYKFVDYDAKHIRDYNTKEKYVRIPNHMMCWKKEICLPFPDKSFGEDQDWAKSMLRKIKKQTILQVFLERDLL